MTSASSGDYILTTGASGGTGGNVWVTPAATTTSSPYTITTTSGTSGATWVGGTTVSSSWTDETVKCRFCDKAVEIGIVIQSKEGKKTHVCVKCAKEYMGGDKIKELFDLVESLATMAEVAKT